MAGKPPCDDAHPCLDGRMTLVATPQPAEDHRVRVGRERRARTRNRLLDTILATYQGDHQRGPAVLGDVLAAADVSKAAFYKHFVSLEAAVADLGERLADEMAVAIVDNFAHVTRPRDRLAMGFQLFLARAAGDPRWTSFVTHGNYLNPAHKLVVEVRHDFVAGIDNGDYRIDDVDAAVHLTIGAMVEGMRHVAAATPASAPGQTYAETLTVMTLQGVGVAAATARTIARRAAVRLADEAGAIFPWWRGAAPALLA